MADSLYFFEECFHSYDISRLYPEGGQPAVCLRKKVICRISSGTAGVCDSLLSTGNRKHGFYWCSDRQERSCNDLLMMKGKNMGVKYRVSSKRIQNDVDFIQVQAREIPAQIRELESSMQKLHGCWKGSARNAFQGEVMKDVAYMNEVYRFLTEYIESLSQSGEDYFKAEYEAYKAAHSLWI